MSEDCPHCIFEKTEANCQGCFEGSHYRPQPMTNADRIRAMTDEELAEFVIGVLCYTKLPYMEVREKALRDNELLDWLKQEAKE